jgi:WD40 repeat protein
MSSEVGVKPALETLWTAHVGSYPSSLSVAYDGSLVAVGTATGELWILEASSGVPLASRQAHGGTLHAAVWAPQSHVLATAGEDGVAAFRGTDGRITARAPGFGAAVEHLTWSDDGRHAAFASCDQARVFTRSGEPLLDFAPRGRTISALGFGPAGAPLAIAHDGGVTLVDPKRGASSKVLASEASPLALAWSPNGAILACGTRERSVRFFRVATGRGSEISRFPSAPRALSWDVESALLAVGGDPSISLWSFQQAGPEGTDPIRLRGHQALCTALAFHPTLPILASGGDDMKVLLWAVRENAAPRGLGSVDDTVVALCWSAGGELLFGTDAAGTVHAWRTVR